MNYTAAISDFFKTPHWPRNLLFGAICVLLPIVGPIVLTGWMVIGFWGRDSDDPAAFPEFQFDDFATYLERGLWPFLVLFVSTLVMMAPFFFLMLVAVFGTAFFADHPNGGCVAAVSWLGTMCLFFVVMILFSLVIAPLKLRASLTQSFSQAFDLSFVKRFITLTWKETLLASLFLMLVNIVFMVVGMLALFVGIYFVMVPFYFAVTHITKQLYRLYLDRGGAAVPISPKLRTT
ncbi:MAG: DUF4013 domain-containing protein [Chthoniobacterales bacterium]